jgi:integrase
MRRDTVRLLVQLCGDTGMPRQGISLTDTAVRRAKPTALPRNLHDTGGLYLTIAPTGAKWWRLKYRFAGKERRMGLGVYPEVTLAEARQRRDQARAMVRDGKDPSIERQAERRKAATAADNTFNAVADEWLVEQKLRLAAVSHEKNTWLVDQVRRDLGSRPISGIAAPDILAALDKIKARGRHETARRAKQCIGQIFAYAIEKHRADRNPVSDLRRSVVTPKSKPRAALTKPEDVGKLLRAITDYQGQPTTLAALKLAPLVFVRPGELRHAEWTELDLDIAEWRIPAHKMKMREEHIVPLAKQAIAILQVLQPLTGQSRYCFPSIRTGDRPMSENTVNAALRALGYDKDTMTGHGFRALASTRLNELGWQPDVIERQLAHAERNKVRAAYNRAQYLQERKKMMQAWADYLDLLKSNPSKVTPIRRKTFKSI